LDWFCGERTKNILMMRRENLEEIKKLKHLANDITDIVKKSLDLNDKYSFKSPFGVQAMMTLFEQSKPMFHTVQEIDRHVEAFTKRPIGNKVIKVDFKNHTKPKERKEPC